MKVAIHSNPHLPNQVESAEWLRQGFDAHGIDAVVTADPAGPGDIHVIQGPHYAYREWVGKDNVLFLNRCFYGNARFDLSIGWLNPDGSRDFCNSGAVEPNGKLPELKPRKVVPDSRACAVVFGDYGEDSRAIVLKARANYGRTYFRPHPAGSRVSPTLSPDWTLEQIWQLADVAVGGASTVLVDAAINGLHIDCHDPSNVVQGYEAEGWLTRLSWAQWSHEQIMGGEFWEHLCVQAD